MSEKENVELFRKALMQAHHHDWSMEIISEAAHICARAISPKQVQKPLKGDMPDKARKRYRNGGFGAYGSPSAKKTFERYMKLFDVSQGKEEAE